MGVVWGFLFSPPATVGGGWRLLRRGYAPHPASMGLPPHTRPASGLRLAANLHQGAGAGVIKYHLAYGEVLGYTGGVS